MLETKQRFFNAIKGFCDKELSFSPILKNLRKSLRGNLHNHNMRSFSADMERLRVVAAEMRAELENAEELLNAHDSYGEELKKEREGKTAKFHA